MEASREALGSICRPAGSKGSSRDKCLTRASSGPSRKGALMLGLNRLFRCEPEVVRLQLSQRLDQADIVLLGSKVDDIHIFGGERRSLKNRGDTPNKDELHLVARQYPEDLVKPELGSHSVRGSG